MDALFRYGFPKALFDKAPKAERVGYLMLGQLWNDTIILTKQMMIARHKPADGHTEHDGYAQIAIELLNLRMLASRMHEGAKVMKRLGQFLKAWKDELQPDAVAAADNLRKYFSNGSAPLSRLRNNMGFHQDYELALQSIETLSEEELFDYRGRAIMNTIFISAEELNLRGLAHLIGAGSAREALNILGEDAMNAMSWTYDACQGFHSWFLEKHIIPYHPLSNLQPIGLEGAPDFDAIQIPFFANVDGLRARVDARGQAS